MYKLKDLKKVFNTVSFKEIEYGLVCVTIKEPIDAIVVDKDLVNDLSVDQFDSILRHFMSVLFTEKAYHIFYGDYTTTDEIENASDLKQTLKDIDIICHSPFTAEEKLYQIKMITDGLFAKNLL